MAQKNFFEAEIMVNIQTTGDFVAEATFDGAYDKRVAKRENESAAKAYKQTEKTN